MVVAEDNQLLGVAVPCAIGCFTSTTRRQRAKYGKRAVFGLVEGRVTAAMRNITPILGRS
jgi:hypothetical protein